NCRVIPIEFPGPAEGLFELVVGVDGDDTERECREDNNEARRPFVALTAPSDEICDGVDNDCDGNVDEDDSGAPLERACTMQCGGGTESCVGGFWSGCSAPIPSPEVCDGVD